jgi:predicted branched-subunit amino acid permease
MTDPARPTRNEQLRAGVRAGMPFAIAGSLLALSFGVVAQGAGDVGGRGDRDVGDRVRRLGSVHRDRDPPQGGTVGAAVLAAALVNSRFLPMGVALGPSLPGGPLRRAVRGRRSSTPRGDRRRGDGTFDRWLLFGSSSVQYLGWVGGTIVGALGGNLLGDPDKIGLDAIYRRSSSR